VNRREECIVLHHKIYLSDVKHSVSVRFRLPIGQRPFQANSTKFTLITFHSSATQYFNIAENPCKNQSSKYSFWCCHHILFNYRKDFYSAKQLAIH